MADLVIRGLHLPKSLGGEETHVDIRIFSDGTVIMATGRPPYYKKFDAVPIPEKHGRLIDADALQAKFELMENALAEHGRPYSFAFKDGGEMCAEWWTVQDALAREPTIIEAEGGEDDA